MNRLLLLILVVAILASVTIAKRYKVCDTPCQKGGAVHTCCTAHGYRHGHCGGRFYRSAYCTEYMPMKTMLKL